MESSNFFNKNEKKRPSRYAQHATMKQKNDHLFYADLAWCGIIWIVSRIGNMRRIGFAINDMQILNKPNKLQFVSSN